MRMTLSEIIEEMNSLESCMQKFEWKYNIKSPEFYQLIKAGKLEENRDFHEWLGLYKIWLKRRKSYLALLAGPSSLLPFTSPIEKDFFQKETALQEV